MADSGVDRDARPSTEGLDESTGDERQVIDALAVASVALSAIGFLTLLRLADHRDRSPAAGVGLFLATTLESTGGTALGLVAAGRTRNPNHVTKGFVFATAGTVLGVITTILNFNWMRTAAPPLRATMASCRGGRHRRSRCGCRIHRGWRRPRQHHHRDTHGGERRNRARGGPRSVNTSAKTQTLRPMLTIGSTTTMKGCDMLNGPTCRAAWLSSSAARPVAARA